MPLNVKSDFYHAHLVEIETYAQTESGIDYGLVDTERLLLDTIEVVRDELRRRYQNVARDPLIRDSASGDCLESTGSDDPQVGWIFRYHDKVQIGTSTKSVPCQDLVRVYELRGETIAPSDWETEPS